MDPRIVFDYSLTFLGLFVTSFMILLFVQNLGRIKLDPAPLKRKPRLTVIIPAYNEEETIGQTVDSVIASDYPADKMEVILVDDGSADGTLSIMRSYSKRHPRLVKVIAKENGGKGTALNAALAVAKGDLIATLDSDSYVEPDALSKMTGFFRDGNTAAVTSVLKVAKPGNFLQQMQRVEYLVTVFSRRLLSYLNSVNVTPGPLSMFRAEVFEAVGGYDEHNILEDQEMALRIQAHNYRIESSMTAVVHTNTPQTFRALARQRIRWHRGGVRNMFKHYYLIGSRYGDFGMVIMPLGVFSILATFAVLLVVASRVLEFGLFSGLSYGLAGVWLGVSPLYILGAFIVASSLLWAYLGVSTHEGEAISPFHLLAYSFIYAPIITLFWLFTAFKELKGEKLSW